MEGFQNFFGRASQGRLSHKRVSRACVPHGRAPHLRAFLARRIRVARILVSTPIVFKASDCGRLGRQAASHPWSALRMVKSSRKDRLTTLVLLEAKAAALHLERYQSSLSKLSTNEGGEAGKRSAGNWIG
jgi:hypothetical protein